ncbi:MAG: tRNA (cytidine(56)-2'-O)-methyltransferase [Candidatus Bathyarchaeota archaeon]|nr:tRNA (cytidine(56)-2'-O)-methyltransferase [Candidatus Bathyarchaeota archaeon]
MRIYVLRLGHRIHRDRRITTHVGLAARAFGADGIIISGDMDQTVMNSLSRVVEVWGGPFDIKYEGDWRKVIENYRRSGWRIVHLTMYGLPLLEVIDSIRIDPSDKLIVVGSEKVPGVVYKLADWNVAITTQPHSEVSALAVFLDRLLEGREFHREFTSGMLKIIPQERGKKVLKLINDGGT